MVSFKLPISLVVFSVIGRIGCHYAMGGVGPLGVVIDQLITDFSFGFRAGFESSEKDAIVF